jgi:hypothetical protein
MVDLPLIGGQQTGIIKCRVNLESFANGAGHKRVKSVHPAIFIAMLASLDHGIQNRI